MDGSNKVAHAILDAFKESKKRGTAVNRITMDFIGLKKARTAKRAPVTFLQDIRQWEIKPGTKLTKREAILAAEFLLNRSLDGIVEIHCNALCWNESEQRSTFNDCCWHDFTKFGMKQLFF